MNKSGDRNESEECIDTTSKKEKKENDEIRGERYTFSVKLQTNNSWDDTEQAKEIKNRGWCRLVLGSAPKFGFWDDDDPKTLG